MPMTLAEWKWRFTMGLLEEIGKECSTQVLVKVMAEIWWIQARKIKGNWPRVFEAGYEVISRWVNDDSSDAEISFEWSNLAQLQTVGELIEGDEDEIRTEQTVQAYRAILLLCAEPNLPYEFKVESKETTLTKQRIIEGFCRNVSNSDKTRRLIHELMPMPPKDPDQMYCILDGTIVGTCNLFSMSERIQCMWDAKLSGCDMSIFKEKKC